MAEGLGENPEVTSTDNVVKKAKRILERSDALAEDIQEGIDTANARIEAIDSEDGGIPFHKAAYEAANAEGKHKTASKAASKWDKLKVERAELVDTVRDLEARMAKLEAVTVAEGKAMIGKKAERLEGRYGKLTKLEARKAHLEGLIKAAEEKGDTSNLVKYQAELGRISKKAGRLDESPQGKRRDKAEKLRKEQEQLAFEKKEGEEAELAADEALAEIPDGEVSHVKEGGDDAAPEPGGEDFEYTVGDMENHADIIAKGMLGRMEKQIEGMKSGSIVDRMLNRGALLMFNLTLPFGSESAAWKTELFEDAHRREKLTKGIGLVLFKEPGKEVIGIKWEKADENFRAPLKAIAHLKSAMDPDDVNTLLRNGAFTMNTTVDQYRTWADGLAEDDAKKEGANQILNELDGVDGATLFIDHLESTGEEVEGAEEAPALNSPDAVRTFMTENELPTETTTVKDIFDKYMDVHATGLEDGATFEDFASGLGFEDFNSEELEKQLASVLLEEMGKMEADEE